MRCIDTASFTLSAGYSYIGTDRVELVGFSSLPLLNICYIKDILTEYTIKKVFFKYYKTEHTKSFFLIV